MNYPTTFYGWLDFWLEYYYKPSVKKNTCTCMSYKIKMIKRLAPNILLTEIDEFFCQNVLNRMYDENYARDTIAKIKTALQKCLKMAVKRNLIADVYLDDLITPKAHTQVVFALSIAQQKLVESVCNKMQYGYLFVFLLYTGLRRSELANLTWNDFDENKREIYIRESKTFAGIRTIPFVQKAYDILTSQPRSDKNSYIFHAPQGGKLNAVFMKRLYIEIREATGIPKFTNHVCRHSFATRLAELGANPKSISVLLGHTKVEYALNIYTNLEKMYVRKEIYLLDSTEGKLI